MNALKSVYILVEPGEGESSFDSEEGLIEALGDLEDLGKDGGGGCHGGPGH